MLGKLLRGATVALLALALASTAAPAEAASHDLARRSTEGGSLTAEDRARLQELGLASPTAAMVIVRKIPRRADGSELARLRSFAIAPAQLSPSGACDSLTPRGQSHAFCSGHVDGPLGRVPARMPIGASFVEGPGGGMLLVRNSGALEVKPLLSWSSVIPPGGLVVAYELVPDGDEWRVTTRLGVQMRAHHDSARTIIETLLKLDAWLTRDLSTR